MFTSCKHVFHMGIYWQGHKTWGSTLPQWARSCFWPVSNKTILWCIFSAHQRDVTWSSRNHMAQTPTQLQSTRDSKWVPPTFLPVLCTSRKNYKVSIAQKQHRGAWLIPSCGLRTAWGARVRLKVALSHPYILQVLRQFLPDHTLDLFLSFTVMSFTLQL